MKVKERSGIKKTEAVWRDLTAYWILGLCNNYGYVVMLSAAHDIIKGFEKDTDSSSQPSYDRDCNILSTGAILLADIIPALIVKFSSPFVPFWINTRILLAVLTAASGFLLVAFASAEWVALLGVVSTSFSSGLGETTFLAYASNFNKNVISTWSSGTGGAGVIGSLSYASLRSLNVSPRDTMLIMLFFPILEAVSFWVLLRKPTASLEVFELSEVGVHQLESLSGFKEKACYTASLMKYMLPLTTVYLFEYFINQGLFELVYFRDIWLDKDAQYRWLQVDYQLGVFLSRSSVNIVTIEKIWIMSILQGINVIYFTFEVIFYVTPSIWIVFSLVFWEGLLGGGAYVNTFYRMIKEVPSTHQEFAMSAVAVSDTLGITLAGFASIPVHNVLCQLPLPNRITI